MTSQYSIVTETRRWHFIRTGFETAELWLKVSRSLDKDAYSSKLLSKPLRFNNRMELERNPNIRHHKFILGVLISLKDVNSIDKRLAQTSYKENTVLATSSHRSFCCGAFRAK